MDIQDRLRGTGRRIGVAYPFEPATLERLQAAAPGAQLIASPTSDQSGVDEVSSNDLDALVGGSLPSDLSRTPSLRWLQTLSVGVDDLVGHGHRWPMDITLTNARGTSATTLGQYAIGAIVRVAERFDLRREEQTTRQWRRLPRRAYAGAPLRGCTLVIVGYGGSGREVARLGAAFGMRVIAVKADPATVAYDGYEVPGTGDPLGTIPERIVGIEDLPDAATEADFLVVCLPSTLATRQVVSRAVIEALPPSAWLINIARGAVVDEPALIDALRLERIGGAALDVFDEEPLPSDSPLWHLPNVHLTPHVAGATVRDPVELVVENLRRFVTGEDLLNRVDPTRGY